MVRHPSGLLAALRDLGRWFDDEQIPAAIIGGIGASLRGRPRLTRDIDAVVFVPDDAAMLESARRFGFVERIDDVLAFARRSRMLLLRHAASGTDIDVSFGAIPFEQEVIQRAERLTIGGATVPIATAEDLVIMKSLARRPRDIADVESILEANPGIDLARIRSWVTQIADLLEMPEIRDDLETMIRKRRTL